MSKALRMVIAVDAAGSYAMPAVLLGTVPLMMAFDDHAGLIGMLILTYMVVLGLLGVAMAGLSGWAMSRQSEPFRGATPWKNSRKVPIGEVGWGEFRPRRGRSRRG